jgi:hypothetical protein
LLSSSSPAPSSNTEGILSTFMAPETPESLLRPKDESYQQTYDLSQWYSTSGVESAKLLSLSWLSLLLPIQLVLVSCAMS